MWSNTINQQVIKLVNGSPPTEIGHVIKTLRDLNPILDQLEDANGQNPVLAFNRLYLRITEDVAVKVDDRIFGDWRYMDRLDVEFAKLYFEALRGWAMGVQVAEAWEYLFRGEHEGQPHSDFEGALLGVNAHINHDLTFALINAETADVRDSDGLATRHADYDVVNDIFIDNIGTIKRDLIDRLRGRFKRLIWRAIDGLLGVADDFLAVELIEKARDQAWKRAENLSFGQGSSIQLMGTGRNDLAAALARILLSSDLFFTGPSDEFNAALPRVTEAIFTSDLLDLTPLPNGGLRAESFNPAVKDHWEGSTEALASLVLSDWLQLVLDAEEDPRAASLVQLRDDIETLRAEKSFLETGDSLGPL